MSEGCQQKDIGFTRRESLKLAGTVALATVLPAVSYKEEGRTQDTQVADQEPGIFFNVGSLSGAAVGTATVGALNYHKKDEIVRAGLNHYKVSRKKFILNLLYGAVWGGFLGGFLGKAIKGKDRNVSAVNDSTIQFSKEASF